MKKVGLGLLLSVVVLMNISGCSHSLFKQTDNYLEIAGIKFRKTGSINTDMLWAGLQKQAVQIRLSQNFFQNLSIKFNIVKLQKLMHKQQKLHMRRQ